MILLKVDDWFFILNNKYRRQIFRLCSIRPCYPQQIADILHLSPSIVSKHIQELEKRKFIVKREESRSEGGRNLQYYFVPFRPRFNFNLASDDLIDIEIVDESEKSVPETHSRKKLISINSFNDNEINSIKENFKILAQHEHDKLDAVRKLRQVQHDQEHFFKNIQSKNSSQQRILFKIIRYLLDQYGFIKSFSYQDLEFGLGIDLDSVKEIIQLLSEESQIITKVSSESWMLNSYEKKDQMDYT